MTVGGVALKLKVVRSDGASVTFLVALVRGLMAAFSILLLFLGFLWIAWDKDKQGWHDKIAGTTIVHVPKGTSLIFVSHNMEAVRRVCDRGLVMYRGENIFQGTASEAIVAYSNAIRQAAREMEKEIPVEGGLSQRVMTFDAEIEKVVLQDANRNAVNVLHSDAPAIVAIYVYFHKDVYKPIFSMTVRSSDGRLVYDTTTDWMKIQTPNFFAGERCCVEFILNIPLLENEYQLGADVIASDLSHYYDRIERGMSFWVEGFDGAKGLVDLNARVAIKKITANGEVSCINQQ